MPDESSNFTSLKGQVLVASTELQDPNFKQSLVWLADHTEEGALGFIVNRPVDKTLGDVAGGPGMTDALLRIPLGFGGPVQPQQLALVVYVREGEQWQCRWGLPVSSVEAFVTDPDARVRAYMGYAGWGEGQLEREVEELAWRVVSPEEALLDLRLVRGMWPLLIRRDERWKSLRGHMPHDEQLN